MNRLISDDEIMDKIQGRVHLDFEATCMPLRPVLVAKAMQLVREPAAAQDLVQDTLLHAFLAWDRFRVFEGEDPTDRASAWLHRNLMNQFITTWRAKARHRDVLENRQIDVVDSTAGDTMNVGGMACAEQRPEWLSGSLWRALLKLDPLFWEVVLRCDLQGDTYREVAESIGVPINTIKSRLYDARRRLAESLQAESLEQGDAVSEFVVHRTARKLNAP